MTKSKNTTKEEPLVEVKEQKKESTLYFFYTEGCGWCKKVMPHIDVLNEEGYEILKLDLANGDNRKLQDEVKKEYKHQCGTPYFVDAETGNTICGFREKDVIEKWAKGEEIPQPIRPSGPPPRIPLLNASKEELKKWKKEYNVWYKKNKEVPNVKDAEQMLKLPRPKTEPPKPPNPNFDDKALDKWGKEYDKWKTENEHLPGLVPADSIIERFKQRRDGTTPTTPTGAPALAQAAPNNPEIEARITRIEQKVDRMMNHFGVK